MARTLQSTNPSPPQWGSISQQAYQSLPSPLHTLLPSLRHTLRRTSIPLSKPQNFRNKQSITSFPPPYSFPTKLSRSSFLALFEQKLPCELRDRVYSFMCGCIADDRLQLARRYVVKLPRVRYDDWAKQPRMMGWGAWTTNVFPKGGLLEREFVEHFYGAAAFCVERPDEGVWGLFWERDTLFGVQEVRPGRWIRELKVDFGELGGRAVGRRVSEGVGQLEGSLGIEVEEEGEDPRAFENRIVNPELERLTPWQSVVDFLHMLAGERMLHHRLRVTVLVKWESWITTDEVNEIPGKAFVEYIGPAVRELRGRGVRLRLLVGCVNRWERTMGQGMEMDV